MTEDNTRQTVNQDDDDEDDEKAEEDRASSRGHIFFDASSSSSAAVDASASAALSSSFVPPGSNVACTNNTTVRVRNEWNALSKYDRALYLDAIETAVERGYHQRFAKFHYETLSELQDQEACDFTKTYGISGFFLWHRIFLLAYEDMLRSLGARYACLTIPYWDIYGDYRNQKKHRHGTFLCRSYATCSRITNELGGIVTIVKKQQSEDAVTYFGDTVEGVGHVLSPVQNLRDENNRVGVIRGDLWFDNPLPSQLVSVHHALLFPLERHDFHQQLQYGLHDAVHDTIGGLMQTKASPLDPLYMPLQSTMELYDYLWEVCHANTTKMTTTSTSITTTTTTTNDDETMTNRTDDDTVDANDANEKRCTYINNEEVSMKLNNNDTEDIREDPLIGHFFSSSLLYYANYSTILQLNQHQRFRYKSNTLPELLRDALSTNTQLCPNGLSSILTPQTPTTTTSREPPTFTTSQLETFKFDWMTQAHVYYSTATNNTIHPQQQEQQEQQELSYTTHLDFVTCLLTSMDPDTLERWAIDEGTFLTQVLQHQRYHNHPSCRDFLIVAGSSNNTNNDNTTIKHSSSSSSSSSHTILYYGRQQQQQQQQQCCSSLACAWLVFLLLLQIVLFKLME